MPIYKMNLTLRNNGLILLLFQKAMVKLSSSLLVRMTIPPETYAFVLETDYQHVRRWALNGKTPKKRPYLASVLRIDANIIKNWVKHNEAHRKMAGKTTKSKLTPIFKYEDFYEQYLMVEEWLKRGTQF